MDAQFFYIHSFNTCGIGRFETRSHEYELIKPPQDVAAIYLRNGSVFPTNYSSQVRGVENGDLCNPE